MVILCFLKLLWVLNYCGFSSSSFFFGGGGGGRLQKYIFQKKIVGDSWVIFFLQSKFIKNVPSQFPMWLMSYYMIFKEKVVSLYGASPYCLFPGCIVTCA